MARATVTFLKSDFMKQNKNGVACSEGCWNNFVSWIGEKFTAGEFSSVSLYADPERIECTIDVQDTVVKDGINCSMEWFY